MTNQNESREIEAREKQEVETEGTRPGHLFRPDVDILALETLVAGVVARAVVAQHSFTSATVESLVELISTAAAPQA